MQEWITVPGGRLNVVSEGSGPPIVLLHAGIADLRSFDALAPLLVTEGYRVVRFDARGHGESPPPTVPFSAHADVVAVLEGLMIPAAALVGNSRGGAVAIDTALQHPDQVIAIVGVGSDLDGFEGPLTDDELSRLEEGDRLLSEEPRNWDALVDMEVRVWVDGLGQSPDRVPSAVRETVRMMIQARHRSDSPIKALGLDPPASQRLASLSCPVLEITGALDLSVVAATASFIADSSPLATAEIWPNVAQLDSNGSTPTTCKQNWCVLGPAPSLGLV